MKNIGLIRFEHSDVNNFTSSIGIKIRRIINKPIRCLIRIGTGKNIIVDSYPNLDRKKTYIFASTHSCVEEVPALLGTIDRSVYSLIGTTDQLEHNPAIYANWVTGMIYVDRMNEESRKQALPKMKRIIDEGSSILLFPEGGWNNTENLLCQKLFSGVYKLAKQTSSLVVPISTFKEYGSNNIYINFGNPINIAKYDKNEGLLVLRDNMSTLMYEQIEKHSTKIDRKKTDKNLRLQFMEERKNEYLSVKWSKDVWEEELTEYIDKENPRPSEVRKFVDKVDLNKNNIYILKPIINRRNEDKKYNFKDYMHNNWNK